MNEVVFRSGEVTEYTASPADLGSDAKEQGIICDAGRVHSLDGLQVASNIVDELKANGISETLNSAFWMVFSFDAWTVSLTGTELRNDGSFGSGNIIDSGHCFNNTVQDYSVLVSSVESYIANRSIWDKEFNKFEFIGFNTSMKGDGETVDEAYLASHPITADTTFYAVFKEKTAGNDASSADNLSTEIPAQLGADSDVNENPGATDLDAGNADAGTSKDNTGSTDPAQIPEGSKEDTDQTV